MFRFLHKFRGQYISLWKYCFVKEYCYCSSVVLITARSLSNSSSQITYVGKKICVAGCRLDFSSPVLLSVQIQAFQILIGSTLLVAVHFIF
jgi:hypothetical protein